MKKGLCIALLLLLCANLPAEIWVRINKVEMTLSVFDGGTRLATYPIACGKVKGNKVKKGDMRTPEGFFTVTQIQDSHTWSHDFGDGKGVIEKAYGPWFIRLSSGYGIGIHGTHDPGSMGKRASEGCIRLRNEDLKKLKPLLQVGTEVEIRPDRL